MIIDKIIKDRRSVRSYKDKKIKKNKIEKIIYNGCLAPSAKNSQPWYFKILSDNQKDFTSKIMIEYDKNNPDRLSTMSASANILRKAPVAVAVCVDDKNYKYPASLYISIGACIENMCLTATALGLGSLIMCDIDLVADDIKFNLNMTKDICAIVIFGYKENTRGNKIIKSLKSDIYI